MADKKKTAPQKDYPKSVKYKGRSIKFFAMQDRMMALTKGKSAKAQTPERSMKVKVDDKEFEVHETPDGLFGSILMPYTIYGSPVELAQDVIDHVPAFRK